jgi:hypothetical protein
LFVFFLAAVLASITIWKAGTAHAATYYVSPAGTGSGASATSPRKAQSALDTARDGDTLIFLDGTYPTLSLTAKDVGAGIIALRAYQPILSGIDTSAGTATGLRSTGAVLGGSGGSRGLYVYGHNGLVVDGLKFVSSGQGLALKNVKNVTVSRNHFNENSTIGLGITGSSTALRVTQNYFTNQRTASVGAHMDYGLFASHSGTLAVDGNLIVGRFNQGMSLKMFVSDASFTGNVFACASGSCLMLGQENDVLQSGKLVDRTVGKVTVSGNKFKDNGYTSVFASNVEEVTISGNSFSNVSRLLFQKYDVAKSGSGTPTTGGRLPKTLRLVDNVIANASYMFLEGRGTIGQTVAISGNEIKSLRDCRTLKMSTAGVVVGEQTAGYPTVQLSNAGLSCPQR